MSPFRIVTCLLPLIVSIFLWSEVLALNVAPALARSTLVAELQRCSTPLDVLNRIGRHVTPTIDPDGSLCSLILVRCSKQLIRLENAGEVNTELIELERADKLLVAVTNCLTTANLSNINSLVEGTKACSILARLLCSSERWSTWKALVCFWERNASELVQHMQDHHLSSIKWAFDSFRVVSNEASVELPISLQDAYDDLHLPFCILPGCLTDDAALSDLSVAAIVSEVDFRLDDIRTTSSAEVVKERRQTAWQGDDGVGPFCYSGKSMPRSDWSSTVKLIRERLAQATGQYYDGCLLNLYPDGRSGMRYHIDPDQGSLWDYDTAVVSIGATRRFAFRRITRNSYERSKGQTKQQPQPHNYVIMHGDVTYMFGDCQKSFQHAVKNADNKNEATPRVSLVFKRTWTDKTR